MQSNHSICSFLAACLAILHLSCAVYYTNAATGDVEPPFPQIISPLQVNRHRIHIVSESVSDKYGYETYEELVDLDEGKDTLVVNNKKGHHVAHIDGANNLIFRYAPYTCAAFTPEEMELVFPDNLWTKRYSMKSSDGKTTKEMHLYGVTALWMNVAELPKSYSTSSMVYSASKDIAKSAHKWSVNGHDNKVRIHFYFIDNSARSSGTKLSLEVIQVESLVSMKIIHTLNILSLEYSFSDSYDSLMRVPVGYGCINSDVTSKALIEFPSIESLYLGPLMSVNHKIQLEATATKFKETNDGIEQSSDTISYEIAHTSPAFSTGNPGLQSIRQRDAKKDIKTVSNYQFNVEYKIDMRKGTCKLANMGARRDKGEKLSLEFNNDLKLAIDVETFKTIFVNTDDFYFIGRSKKVIEYLYFEKTTNKIFEGKRSRIIRTYSTNQAILGEVKLESVTIWVFDENFENIIESYHLNVIDAVFLNSFYKLSRTFDITEECYLNNENMVEGKDYSWFELHYPVPARYNAIIASKVMTVKEMIYTRFSSDGVSFFLAPRLEIMFEDTGFILRILQIDIPSINYLYDLKEGFILSIDKTQGDAEDLTVDLNHCTDLCRLSYCKTMSYCENDHLCLISTSLPDNDKHKLLKNKSCMTYQRPTLNPVEEENDEEFEKLMELKLQRVIGVLQHQDYDALSLPKMPDELWYPKSETGINEEEYNKVLQSYLEEVINFIKTEGHRLPMLTFTMEIEGALVILTPNKFELEQDPLSEFKLTDKDDSLEDGLGSFSSAAAAPFHEGLSMHRFKINAFNEANQQNSRLFTGLNYDQCALACVDSKCSSFSFCSHRQECIITDLYSIGESMGNIIELDSDCMIMQRDFLSKFNKFQNVFRPNIYKKSTKAFNPSECAHTCVIETDFKCLAFDFCSTSEGSSTKQSVQVDSCLLLEDRQIYTGIGDTQNVQQSPSANKQIVSNDDKKRKKKQQQQVATGCDHYSRSYLADFLRIEYRQIDDSEMSKLKTSIIEGRSVDQCADECVNQLTDCTAFQFCFDPDIRDGAMQSCTFIESRPEEGTQNTNIVVDEKDGGKVVKASELFVANRNCHVFSLRHDTSEAHLRELALNGMTKEEMETNEKLNKVQSSGISIGGGILLYLSVTLIFSAIGCGIVIVKHHNDYVRQRIERIQLLLGI